MDLSREQRDLLALRLVPGIGPKLTAALLERFGAAPAIATATLADLTTVPHLGEKVATAVQNSLRSSDVDAELELMQRHGVKVHFDGSAGYPVALANVSGRPQMLFVKGRLVADEAQAVAIVGSRSCTSYGLRVAHRLAQELASAGFTIVSGLARGIDAAAHRGALAAKGRTVAVLAGGLAKIYPPEHTELAEQIVADGGALVTESPMRMEPMAGMFPARNRIISGLSRGVVLVEAAEKSGALITARHAGDQGREVFAVPGPVDSVASAGALLLLREGAKLVRHARDVIDDLNGIAPLIAQPTLFDARPAPAAPPAVVAPPPYLDPIQLSIWDTLSEPRSIDDLCRHTKMPIAELAGMLMTMELKRLIRRLPGSVYERA